MNTFKKRICAFVVTACLICMSVVPAMADTNATPESTDSNLAQVLADDVRTEAMSTAKFLMDNTDFSSIDKTSAFYNASRNLILSVRSGYDCSKQIDEYIKSVKGLVNSDGTLNTDVSYDSYTADFYSSYAYLLMALAVTGQDATDFNGANIVAAFDNIIGTVTVETLTTNLNPYYLGAYYCAIDSYKLQLTNADRAIATAKSALLSLCTDNQGIEYWGHSADNNGIVLPFFASLYKTDADVKEQIDYATAYTKSLANEDGTITSWGSLNCDSTALALAMHAQFGSTEFAATTYNGLVSTFKSDETKGAYNFDSSVSLYATQDAMIGLVTYLHALEDKANPFDVSAEVKAIADIKNNAGREDNTNNDDDTNNDTNTGINADDNINTDNDSNTQNSSTKEDKTSVQTADSYDMYFYALLALTAISGTYITGYGIRKRQ